MSSVKDSSNMSDQNKCIVIIGGSLTGLMLGIMFKRRGHDVHILEQSLSSVRVSQAGGITVGPQIQRFLEKYNLVDSPYSLSSSGVKILTRDSNMRLRRKMQIQNTSWDNLYYQLRANYDGFRSQSYPMQPLREKVEREGKAEYSNGRRVTNVLCSDKSIIVEFEDLTRGGNDHIRADLVLAANGANSNIRPIVLPQSDLQRPYAGYLAWRGIISEDQVSAETRSLFEGENSLYIMGQSYIVIYMIPGPKGSLTQGERFINFVWYHNCETDALAEILTDIDGHQHRHSVPVGKIRSEVWAKQKAIARDLLSPHVLELIANIATPFVTVVSDTMASRASFFDGKLLLVGDALSLFRPHISSSTNQSAFHCLLLEECLRGELSLEDWELQVLQYAKRSRLRSVSWGAYFQVGWVAYLFSEIALRSQLLFQWLGNWWYGRENGIGRWF